MTTQQAKENIGQAFKVNSPGHGLFYNWDKIISVSHDGYVIGEFLKVPVELARLKHEVPQQFKKQEHVDH